MNPVDAENAARALIYLTSNVAISDLNGRSAENELIKKKSLLGFPIFHSESRPSSLGFAAPQSSLSKPWFEGYC